METLKTETLTSAAGASHSICWSKQVLFNLPDNFKSKTNLTYSGWSQSLTTTDLLHYPDPGYVRGLGLSDERLATLLQNINQVFAEHPANWNKTIYILLKDFLRENKTEAISDFARLIIPKILKVIRNSLRETNDSQPIEHLAVNGMTESIHNISGFVAELLEQQKHKIAGTMISLKEINKIPNVRVLGNIIQITNPSNGESYFLPVPKSPDLLCKGGYPRLLLKLYARAPVSTILSEMPLNDLDIIIRAYSPVARAEVNRLKSHKLFAGLIDPAGTEQLVGLDPANIYASRDMTLNSCYLSSKGLHFSFDAFDDCKIGRLRALGHGKELYGSDCFNHYGLKLLKNCGLMRFIKTLAEDKGKFFEMHLRNTSVHMGIYWLVLARKFMHKENAAELLQNAFQIGKQCGQVRAAERNIFDVLDRVHSQYPFFSFSSGKMDSLDSARWLMKKLSKQITRTFRRKYGHRTPEKICVLPGDEKLLKVSAVKDKKSYISADEFRSQWQEFLERCEKRSSLQSSTVIRNGH